MADDDDKDFEALDAEDVARVERFIAWQAKKKEKEAGLKVNPDPTGKSPNPSLPDLSNLTLAQIVGLSKSKEHRSILKTLLSEAEASELIEAGKGKEPPTKAKLFGGKPSLKVI